MMAGKMLLALVLVTSTWTFAGAEGRMWNFNLFGNTLNTTSTTPAPATTAASSSWWNSIGNFWSSKFSAAIAPNDTLGSAQPTTAAPFPTFNFANLFAQPSTSPQPSTSTDPPFNLSSFLAESFGPGSNLSAETNSSGSGSIREARQLNNGRGNNGTSNGSSTGGTISSETTIQPATSSVSPLLNPFVLPAPFNFSAFALPAAPAPTLAPFNFSAFAMPTVAPFNFSAFALPAPAAPTFNFSAFVIPTVAPFNFSAFALPAAPAAAPAAFNFSALTIPTAAPFNVSAFALPAPAAPAGAPAAFNFSAFAMPTAAPFNLTNFLAQNFPNRAMRQMDQSNASFTNGTVDWWNEFVENWSKLMNQSSAGNNTAIREMRQVNGTSASNESAPFLPSFNFEDLFVATTSNSSQGQNSSGIREMRLVNESSGSENSNTSLYELSESSSNNTNVTSVRADSRSIDLLDPAEGNQTSNSTMRLESSRSIELNVSESEGNSTSNSTGRVESSRSIELDLDPSEGNRTSNFTGRVESSRAIELNVSDPAEGNCTSNCTDRIDSSRSIELEVFDSGEGNQTSNSTGRVESSRSIKLNVSDSAEGNGTSEEFIFVDGNNTNSTGRVQSSRSLELNVSDPAERNSTSNVTDRIEYSRSIELVLDPLEANDTSNSTGRKVSNSAEGNCTSNSTDRVESSRSLELNVSESNTTEELIFVEGNNTNSTDRVESSRSLEHNSSESNLTKAFTFVEGNNTNSTGRIESYRSLELNVSESAEGNNTNSTDRGESSRTLEIEFSDFNATEGNHTSNSTDRGESSRSLERGTVNETWSNINTTHSVDENNTTSGDRIEWVSFLELNISDFNAEGNNTSNSTDRDGSSRALEHNISESNGTEEVVLEDGHGRNESSLNITERAESSRSLEHNVSESEVVVVVIILARNGTTCNESSNLERAESSRSIEHNHTDSNITEEFIILHDGVASNGRPLNLSSEPENSTSNFTVREDSSRLLDHNSTSLSLERMNSSRSVEDGDWNETEIVFGYENGTNSTDRTDSAREIPLNSTSENYFVIILSADNETMETLDGEYFNSSRDDFDNSTAENGTSFVRGFSVDNGTLHVIYQKENETEIRDRTFRSFNPSYPVVAFSLNEGQMYTVFDSMDTWEGRSDSRRALRGDNSVRNGTESGLFTNGTNLSQANSSVECGNETLSPKSEFLQEWNSTNTNSNDTESKAGYPSYLDLDNFGVSNSSDRHEYGRELDQSFDNSSREDYIEVKDNSSSARDSRSIDLSSLSSLSPGSILSPLHIKNILDKSSIPPIDLSIDQKLSLLNSLASSVSADRKEAFLTSKIVNITDTLNSLSHEEKDILSKHSPIIEKLNSLPGKDKFLVLSEDSFIEKLLEEKNKLKPHFPTLEPPTSPTVTTEPPKTTVVTYPVPTTVPVVTTQPQTTTKTPTLPPITQKPTPPIYPTYPVVTTAIPHPPYYRPVEPPVFSHQPHPIPEFELEFKPINYNERPQVPYQTGPYRPPQEVFQYFRTEEERRRYEEMLSGANRGPAVFQLPPEQRYPERYDNQDYRYEQAEVHYLQHQERRPERQYPPRKGMALNSDEPEGSPQDLVRQQLFPVFAPVPEEDQPMILCPASPPLPCPYWMKNIPSDCYLGSPCSDPNLVCCLTGCSARCISGIVVQRPPIGD